jgi:hypothetical protein
MLLHGVCDSIFCRCYNISAETVLLKEDQMSETQKLYTQYILSVVRSVCGLKSLLPRMEY